MKPNDYFILLGILVLVVVIVVAGSLWIFGGSDSKAPSSKTPTLSLKGFSDPGSGSPWLYMTKYAVAYVDKGYSPKLHGKLSTVIQVQSATGTNPTFSVTATPGYDVVVYRTEASTTYDPKDPKTIPVDPTGLDSEFVQALSDQVKDGSSSFTDTNNPCHLPPAGPQIKSIDGWNIKDKAKPPYRIATYYGLALSFVNQKTVVGAQTNYGTPAQNILGYNPVVTFPDVTNAGTLFNVLVYRSQDQKTWTLATDITSFTYNKDSPATMSFTDTGNIYKGPPPFLDASLVINSAPPVTTPCAIPWGYVTSYLAAYAEYSDGSLTGNLGTTPLLVGPLAATAPCPQFTITADPAYSIVLYRTDSSANPKAKQPAVPTKSNVLMVVAATGASTNVQDTQNPFKGVPSVVFGAITWNTTDKANLPFRTSTDFRLTLTDTTNSLVGAPSSAVTLQNSAGNAPVVALQSPVIDPGLYTVKIEMKQTGDSAWVAGEGAASITGATLTVTKNPYYSTGSVLPYVGDFHCQTWDNKGSCQNMCSTACSATECCFESKCIDIKTRDPNNVTSIKNKDGSCIGIKKTGIDTSTIGSACAEDPSNPYFMLQTTHGNKANNPKGNFQGFCVQQCPKFWTKGSIDPQDPSVNVCSPQDPLAAGKNFFGYGYGCAAAPPDAKLGGGKCDTTTTNYSWTGEMGQECPATSSSMLFDKYQESSDSMYIENMCFNF